MFGAISRRVAALELAVGTEKQNRQNHEERCDQDKRRVEKMHEENKKEIEAVRTEMQTGFKQITDKMGSINNWFIWILLTIIGVGVLEIARILLTKLGVPA